MFRTALLGISAGTVSKGTAVVLTPLTFILSVQREGEALSHYCCSPTSRTVCSGSTRKLRCSFTALWSAEWSSGGATLSACHSALALKQELFWYLQWCLLCWKQWLLKSGPSALARWCRQIHFYYVDLSLLLCPPKKKSLRQITSLHLQYSSCRMARHVVAYPTEDVK